MLTKSQISLIRSLEMKKFRRREMLFVAEGEKIVAECLFSKAPIYWLIATREWMAANPINNDFRVFVVDNKLMKSISMLSTPSQVMAIVRIQETVKPEYNSESLFLALDNIQDPGNMGTILRIADWFGIGHVICSENCVDVYNSKVIQASMGAFLRVAAHCNNLTDELLRYRQQTAMPVYGTFCDGDNIYNTDLSRGAMVVMGNEGSGIALENEKIINRRISIPAFSDNTAHAESLNVSVATGIVCAEFRRRVV
ncbi:MAG TPA: RNA methyltransferase [Bacteroidales bacterium]|nr:RNA methyltransferase [Bacteroidales bacterium]